MIPPEHIRTITQPSNQMFVPPICKVKRAILHALHNHPTVGHPGRDETIQKVQEKYWWPGMHMWISKYVKGYATCQQSKNLTHWKHTPLYWIPTKLDTYPFQSIAIDLITGLPLQKGMDAILTIVNHGYSRATVFLPCNTTILGPGIAQLYLDNVYQWFGLPKKIISNQDPYFTSHFGIALTKKLGIQQNLSLAFHLQTNRSSERKNQ